MQEDVWCLNTNVCRCRGSLVFYEWTKGEDAWDDQTRTTQGALCLSFCLMKPRQLAESDRGSRKDDWNLGVLRPGRERTRYSSQQTHGVSWPRRAPPLRTSSFFGFSVFEPLAVISATPQPHSEDGAMRRKCFCIRGLLNHKPDRRHTQTPLSIRARHEPRGPSTSPYSQLSLSAGPSPYGPTSAGFRV